MGSARRVAWVKTHVGSRDAARRLASAVLRERLAACANLETIESDYRWRGRIVRAREVAVTMKTAPRRVAALVEAVERLHPYEVPYIAWGEETVPQPYASWANAETAGRRGRPSPAPRRRAPHRTR